MLALKYGNDARRGFTLVEVLIAFTIGAMIIGILVGVMRLGIRSWEKGHERVDGYQHLRVFTEQIIEDIRSAYLADSEKVTSFIGESDKITLHSSAWGLRPQSNLYGIRRVSYYADPKGRLTMEESFPFDETVKGEEAVQLYSGVEKIEFRYYQVKEGSGEWEHRWNSKDSRGLPAAVEIALTLVDREGQEVRLPPIIAPINVSRTLNITAGAVRATPYGRGRTK